MTALKEMDLDSQRIEGKTGVFMKRNAGEAGPDRKIASIGIGVRHWITYHGFALNVSMDLDGFHVIVPCGLENVEMTSVVREWDGERPDPDARAREAVSRAMVSEFATG